MEIFIIYIIFKINNIYTQIFTIEKKSFIERLILLELNFKEHMQFKIIYCMTLQIYNGL